MSSRIRGRAASVASSPRRIVSSMRVKSAQWMSATGGRITTSASLSWISFSLFRVIAFVRISTLNP